MFRDMMFCIRYGTIAKIVLFVFVITLHENAYLKRPVYLSSTRDKTLEKIEPRKITRSSVHIVIVSSTR